jgi:hypothetical protein
MIVFFWIGCCFFGFFRLVIVFGVGQAKEIGVGKSKTITASNTTHDIIIMMGNQDWRGRGLCRCVVKKRHHYQ